MPLKQPISITASASISALGSTSEQTWQSYLAGKPLFTTKKFLGENNYISELSETGKAEVKAIRKENRLYQKLGNSVLFAIYSARKVIEKSGWKTMDFGVNIGSSRGATGLFEKYYSEFLETGKTATLASPTTTLGNISSWVLQDLNSSGPEISHSITCSTALHAVLNGVAWLQSGMSKKFLVGGSEAPLTPFTIAQMKALKIYAKYDPNDAFPNKSMAFSKTINSMILGEASACFCLENGNKTNGQTKIVGIGYGSEKLIHNVSISEDAECLQKSMTMALKNANLKTVDAVVLHVPGTKKGDLSEFNALKKVFPKKLPLLTSNKFIIGHTFGASGAMSLEMAFLMLKHQQFIENPHFKNPYSVEKLKTIMVNAVGFGGNAVSVIISQLKFK